MSKRRRPDNQSLEMDGSTFILAPPSKRRRKSGILHDDENAQTSDNMEQNNEKTNVAATYQYSKSNDGHNINNGEYACFHFATFRKLPSPHPCLYSSCKNIEFPTWNEWRQHWIEQHRQYYMDNNQMIPVTEFNDDHPKINNHHFINKFYNNFRFNNKTKITLYFNI